MLHGRPGPSFLPGGFGPGGLLFSPEGRDDLDYLISGAPSRRSTSGNAGSVNWKASRICITSSWKRRSRTGGIRNRCGSRSMRTGSPVGERITYVRVPADSSRPSRRTRTRGAGSTRSGSTATPAWTKPTPTTSSCTVTRTRSPAPARSRPCRRRNCRSRLCSRCGCACTRRTGCIPCRGMGRSAPGTGRWGRSRAAGHAEQPADDHGRRVAPVLDGRH